MVNDYNGKTIRARKFVDAILPSITATVIDGGIIHHETVLQHSKSTYATMARDLLAKVCLSRGEQVHLALNKYQTPSIKDVERYLRRSTTSQAFIITGPDQAQRQSGTELLKNGSFKEEVSRFVMQEWKKPQYGHGHLVYVKYTWSIGNCDTWCNIPAPSSCRSLVAFNL